MPETYQGKLWLEWHIACATCRAEDSHPMARVSVTRYLRKLGWVWTRRGWQCPECAGKGERG